ncbi:ParA family protein [Paraburkholderia agricolaris]|uniref:ParA family protein n=1 Tax=Paraburkholderia agricolaris TaxID=2152888 RepID=UPI0038BD25E6
MKILAVANQKGGVGKSTLTVHLGYAAEEAGLRVLLVDMDRQGSLSHTFAAVNGNVPGFTASSLFGSGAPAPAEPERLSDTLSIIRSDEILSSLSGGNKEALRRPATHLRSLASRFDVCLIDTPGVIGLNPPMTMAALVAADAVVCPFSVGFYEGKGLADLWNEIKRVKSQYNPKLNLIGLLPSKVNSKSKEEIEGLEMLRPQFGQYMLPGMLAERTAVKQAVMKLKPVWKGVRGAGHKKAAEEWRSATATILAKLGVVKQ